MKKQTFLIIGSNSFSGSNLIYKLLEINNRNKVIGISRSNEYKRYFLKYKNSKNLKNFKFFKYDIKETKKILKLINIYKPKYILNYAALGMVNESWFSPEDWYKTNLVYQALLYKNLVKVKFIKKIIHVSTPEVYGNTKKKIRENFDFNPSTPYAISRAAMDFHLKKMSEQFKLPIIFTRTANVYGPGQQLYRIIPKSILKLKKRQKVQIHGTGKSVRSFIFIDDASEATLRILQKGSIGETYHITTSNKISIKKLVQKITKILKINFNQNIKYVSDRIGKDQAYDLSSEKILKKMNWKPKISLEKGLIKTINWINENYSNFKKMKTEYKHKR